MTGQRNDEAADGVIMLNLFTKPHDVKLQIKIDIKELEKSMSEGHYGGNALNARVQKRKRLISNLEAVEEEDGSNRQPASKVNLLNLQRQEIINEFNDGNLATNDVQGMFLKGMGSSRKLEIVSVYRCSSPNLQTRLELFEKQIKLTEAYRGNANVQYAWLASSEQEITKILMYGLGHCVASIIKSTYGVGVYLTPVGSAHTSANNCEVGRNGLRHMILLGNLEVIQRRSCQFRPSSLDYDTGVDDLQNPRHYIVWNFNSNTHIYLEYVVTFKMTSNNMHEGYLGRGEADHDVSGAPVSAPLAVQGPMQTGSSVFETGSGSNARLRYSPFKISRSPRMPFPVLFAAISTEIPPRDMEVINEKYHLLRARRTTHDDFVKFLRSIVGDTLLRSALSRIQAEAQAQGKTADHVKASKHERGH